MVKKSKGPRTRSRKKLKARKRATVTKFLQTFKKGDRVVIDIEPSSTRGMPYHRYQGRVGTVIGKRGKSYIVEITDGNKVKRIISRPEHLRVV